MSGVERVETDMFPSVEKNMCQTEARTAETEAVEGT